jgi:hypothetical protein
MAKLYDIGILGATPAGLAAADWLARRRRSVVLIDPPRLELECPLSDWVPGSFFRVKNLPKGLTRKASAVPFRRVVYHNADGDKRVEHRSRSTSGYFLAPEALDSALSNKSSRIRRRTTKTWPAIRLDDDAVRVLGTTEVMAKVLLIVHARPRDIVSDLSLPVQSVSGSPLVVAGLDIPLPAEATDEDLLDGLHVVEARERSEVGLFFIVGETLHVRIISWSRAAGARAAELTEMLSGLQQAGILPEDLPLAKARGAVWRPPAGVALELETHVAKRCVLAGTAGGFVDPITGHVPMPSVRSALLAAEAADHAVSGSKRATGRSIQTALEHFRSVWRKDLGTYLRPPSTSLQMLLPLLFVNERVVPRFTGALLTGKPI